MNTRKNELWQNIPKKLVFFKNCTEPFDGKDDFFIGDCHVVSSPIGSYRETAYVDGSRFGYRFSVERTDRPHLIEVVYPDDKKRAICIDDGFSYDLSTGIITGDDTPLTYSMRKVSNIFFPRDKETSILVSTINGFEPAAVASISVYELEGLPEENALRGKSEKRKFGIQYEDPCNIGASEGSLEFYDWFEKHISFMRASGQNRLVYPINWYHGPIIPVKSQPYSRFNTLITPNDKRSYCRSAFDIPDWAEHLLSRFDDEGFFFTGSLTLMRLGNLMEKMNIDQKSIDDGAETYNNILYNGMVQKSPNDWTAPYNPVNFPTIVETGKRDKDFEYVYGEKKDTGILAPMFNPLHPEVQKQILEYFGEIAEKYAHHPSFEGLSINFWHGTILWYGNLLVGYDDYSIGEFENHMGITLPIDKKDPKRFEKRYRYIRENLLDEFISFRCERIHDLICRIRDRLTAVRADLKLTLNIWNETSFYGYYTGLEGFPYPKKQESEYGNAPSPYDVYTMGGLDLSLYENEKNVLLSVERSFCRDMESRGEGEVYSRCFTDPFWLDGKLFSALRTSKGSEGFFFNCWVERWGTHTSFACEEDDEKNIAMIKALPDYCADFIYRQNCTYADDKDGKFFFESECRINSLLPPEDGFSEWLGADLALHDALSITAGGLYLDKAHLPHQLDFAREYVKLPAEKFNDIPSFSDPLCIRWLNKGAKTYVYVLNREPYEILVSFECGENKEEFTIAPFGLRVFEYEGEFMPSNICMEIPIGKSEEYEALADEAKKALDFCISELGDTQRCLVVIREQMDDAMKNKRYSTLRHLLSSYGARYALRLYKG